MPALGLEGTWVVWPVFAFYVCGDLPIQVYGSRIVTRLTTCVGFDAETFKRLRQAQGY
jgi:hypothetical protein